jgi:hypothetical protein
VLKAEIGRNKVLNQARSDENQIYEVRQLRAPKRGLNLAESDRARPGGGRFQARQRVAIAALRRSTIKTLRLFLQQRLTDTLGRSLTNVQDKMFSA